MSLRKSLVFLYFFYFDIVVRTDAKRILGVFPLNEKSHNNVLEALMKGLAKRGHQVDVITHFELKNPPKNYRAIVNLNGTREDFVNNLTFEYCSKETDDPIPFYAFTAGNEICNLMALEKIQNVVKNPPIDPAYDLVITEVFGANCYIGFGYVFQVPVITVATNLGLSWTGDGVGSPTPTAFYADVLMEKSVVITFWERLKNTIISHISKYRYFKYTEKAQTEAMRKYLGQSIPNIREVERSVALTFVNSYHNPFGIRSTTPGLIEIGGIHIEEDDAKFTPDLEQWMNESLHGVVYFTLGSMVLIETMPEETLFAFYESFSKIAPIRVLMKIASKDKLPPGLPKNVRTSSWIPQIPVLRHHNTRLFITHGGMLGIQEALYYKVPMIGIPLYGDQFRNVATMVDKNIAIYMDYKKINKTALDEALNSILKDAKYKAAAIHESRLFLDRPMKPMDTAIFWVEYIMRNGENSLKSPIVKMYWWQVELLDVYGFILFCCIILIYSVIFIIKTTIRNFFQIFKKTSEKKKKK